MSRTTADELTLEQARDVARVVHELRPDWDMRGIVVALGKARAMGSACEVAAAALLAAGAETNRTPAVIALKGPHWVRGGTRREDRERWQPVRRDEEECPRHPGERRERCRGCAADRIARDEDLAERPGQVSTSELLASQEYASQKAREARQAMRSRRADDTEGSELKQEYREG